MDHLEDVASQVRLQQLPCASQHYALHLVAAVLPAPWVTPLAGTSNCRFLDGTNNSHAGTAQAYSACCDTLTERKRLAGGASVRRTAKAQPRRCLVP